MSKYKYSPDRIRSDRMRYTKRLQQIEDQAAIIKQNLKELQDRCPHMENKEPAYKPHDTHPSLQLCSICNMVKLVEKV